MIRLIKPYISFAEVEDDFRAVFESGMFTRGEHVEAFRKELATYTGASHAYLATSATTALSVCLRMLGIGSGDEVIVADFSFPASANVVEDVGARPVFADVSLDTYNLLPQEVERRISSRTKAVMFVDALGNPTGLHDIKTICERRGIPLIEDAACALGSAEAGHQTGGIADVTCFSFHPRKLICTGEGGAITTNRSDWAKWLEVKLSHGASGMLGPGLDFVEYGFNYRMSELQAVMGRRQLSKLDTIVSERSAIRQQYLKRMDSLGFREQLIGSNVIYNVQSLVFRVPEGCERDDLIKKLKQKGVEATLGTYSLSGTTYYRARYNDVQPNAECLQRETITLPCYDGVDVERVVHAIEECTQ